MTTDTDIDQMLTQAAGPERASHVDPDFVTRVDQLLNSKSGWHPRGITGFNWLGLLPVLAVVLASVLAAPVLTGESAQAGALWNWLSELPGLQSGLDALLGAGPGVLWPYVVGLLVMVLPFSLLDAEV